MSAHHCHAYDCPRSVPPKLLMCARHWRMVPDHLKALVWKHYRPGQEIDKDPSREYLMVQRSAIWAVFVAEGGCSWPDVPEVGTPAFMLGPRVIAPRIAPQQSGFEFGSNAAQLET